MVLPEAAVRTEQEDIGLKPMRRPRAEQQNIGPKPMKRPRTEQQDIGPKPMKRARAEQEDIGPKLAMRHHTGKDYIRFPPSSSSLLLQVIKRVDAIEPRITAIEQNALISVPPFPVSSHT